jgi:hypothetical protein
MNSSWWTEVAFRLTIRLLDFMSYVLAAYLALWAYNRRRDAP